MTKESTLRQTDKHLKDILLLFSIPIAIIIVLVAFLYIPRLFANPAYNFVYCEGYYCDGGYSVGANGNLQEAPDQSTRSPYVDGYKLFYYDVERDATRPVQFDEATRYKLDTSSKSPDGYTLKHSSGGGGFLFWGDYQNNWVLKKGIVSKPISLDSSNSNEFIGWVVE
jgi:hypothetical protein